jgi:hypothetical protein
MNRWNAVKQEVATKLATAAREAQEAANAETDPARKQQLLDEYARMQSAYYLLHGSILS